MNTRSKQATQTPAPATQATANTHVKRTKSLLNMRTDSAAIVRDENGDEVPLKTGVMVDIDYLDLHGAPLTPVRHNFETALNQVSSNRPIARICNLSDKFSPMKVSTPGGTTLHRERQFGSLSFFSNRVSTFRSSSHYHNLSNAMIKMQQMTVTATQLNATQAENHKRVPSQNQVKGQSAKEHAAEKKINIQNFKWEWLHLVANMIAGKKSQTDDNLVGGSNHSNTDMMIVENNMKYLAKHYPQGFDIEVSAMMIDDTDVAAKINYNIKTADFSLPFEFDALVESKPHIALNEYIHRFIEALVKSREQQSCSSSSTTTSNNFYSKKMLAMQSQDAAMTSGTKNKATQSLR